MMLAASNMSINSQEYRHEAAPAYAIEPAPLIFRAPISEPPPVYIAMRTIAAPLQPAHEDLEAGYFPMVQEVRRGRIRKLWVKCKEKVQRIPTSRVSARVLCLLLVLVTIMIFPMVITELRALDGEDSKA